MPSPPHNPPPPERSEPQLKFTTTLYGREKETSQLNSHYAQACVGNSCLLLVPGLSGSGKTSLIHSLKPSVEKSNGFFLQGKFNQFDRESPLLGLRLALRSLALSLLNTLPDDHEKWRKLITASTGHLTGLLLQIAPELESLLGPQPEVPEIPPHEAIHRFTTTLRNFLRALCQPENPVVLFIDDWQWADPASLQVLHQLLSQDPLRYLLFIAAYRENEVDALHPFHTTIQSLQHNGFPQHTLKVEPLTTRDIQSLLQDTFTPSLDNPRELANLIRHTTHGNPFFIRTLLLHLHQQNTFHFQPQQSRWSWNQEQIQHHSNLDIVQLFAQQLQQLPQTSQQLLSTASCIGTAFDIETLRIASSLPANECLQLLQEPITQQLILLERGKTTNHKPKPPLQFVFRHDRIQQAAHSLIPTTALPALRLRIGQSLLQHLPDEQSEDQLIEITEHLNAGRSLLTQTRDLIDLVRLNIRAAHKAKATTAYQSACNFHRTAGQILAQNNLTEYLFSLHYPLAIQLFKAWSTSESLAGNQTAADACINQAVTHSKDPIDRADILAEQIVQYTLLARYQDAIQIGITALESLNVKLPADNLETHRDEVMRQIHDLLAQSPLPKTSREQPAMSDPRILMATRLLITLGPPCYRAHQRLWGLIVAKAVHLILQYGPVPQISYSHPAYGGLLAWVSNDYNTGKLFGNVAASLMADKYEDPSSQSVFYLMIGSSLRHWSEHLSASSQDFTQAWETGLHSGNLQYAAYAFGHSMYCRYYQGAPLQKLIKDSSQSLDFSRSRTNQWAIDLLHGGIQIFLQLASPQLPQTPAFPETDYLNDVDRHGNIQVACIYRVLKSHCLLLLGQFDQALSLSNEADPLIYTVGTQGLLPWPEHVTTRLLLLIIRLQHQPATNPPPEIQRLLQQLQTWTQHCPTNYQHKLALAQAELARLNQQHQEALTLYEQSLSHAAQHHFVQWEAFAAERASSLAESLQQHRLASLYWQYAYNRYSQWGALNKTKLMEDDFLQSIQHTSNGNLHTTLSARLKNLATPHPTSQSGLALHEDPDHSIELGEAARHLREEVALRKKIESELIHHQERLLQEIAEKGHALETSRQMARNFEHQASELEQNRTRLAAAHAATLNLMEDVVAARDRAEQISEALREGEERLRLALDAGHQGIYDVDLIHNTYQTSPEYAQMLGHEPDSFTESLEAWLDRTHPEDRTQALNAFQACASGQIPEYRIEHRQRTPDGQWKWILSVGRTVAHSPDGKPSRLIGTRTDITEIKKAQETLQQRNEELTRFVYTVSHDLKSPLVTIQTFLGYLEKDLLKKDEQRIRSDMDYMSKSTRKMILMLEELLELARAAHKIDSVDTFTLQDIAQEAADLVAGAIAQHNVQLKITPTPYQLKGDRRRLLEVFQNLIDNAVKFMADQPNPLIEINVDEQEEVPAIVVRDNGAGIDPKYQDRLFGLFEKLEPDSPGSGIGLALVQQIIQLHGGRISLHSKGPGHGAAFRFTLPGLQRL